MFKVLECNSLEYIIQRRPAFKDYVYPAVAFSLAFACLPTLLAGLAWSLIPMALFSVSGYFLYCRLYTEIEYAYCNGILTVDYIYKQTRRKTGIELECRNISVISPYQTERKEKFGKYDFRSHQANKPAYALSWSQGGQEHKALIEPSTELAVFLKIKSD